MASTSSSPAEHTTRALTSEDANSGFTSGVTPLDEYFRTQAGQNQRRDMSRTWVMPRPDGDSQLPVILGYYTLTLGSIEREHLPLDVTKRLPRYPLPIVIMGRLAVDQRARGKGYGARLLHDAHQRALAINAQGGCIAVVVDARDEDAAAFYARFGYMPLLTALEGWPRRMYLPIATLRKALRQG